MHKVPWNNVEETANANLSEYTNNDKITVAPSPDNL